MTVSVVIPAFNATGFLAKAVSSALAQIPSPLEVIIVDDASTDDTRAVAEALAAGEPRIRVLALPVNGGPAMARNAGFAAARGEWIAVLDADDAFAEGRLRRLLETAAASSADIVADNIASYDHIAGQIVGVGVRSVGAPRTIDVYDFVGASRGPRKDIDWGLLKPMFRRAFLAEHALAYPEGLRHGEDFVFVFQTLLAGARFIFTPEPGYLYTQRWGVVSKTPSGLSRTRVDYDAMARDTLRLMEDGRVAGDGRLRRLMRRRYDGIRALDAHHKAARYLGERKVGALLRLLAENPRAAKPLSWMILRKVGRLAGARA